MSERIDTVTLRNKILNLAFSGKLVKQDPNDEPASVLLERIRKEKETLVKEGKIKKSNQESIIFKGDDNHYYEKIGKQDKDITIEIDFFLPSDWAVARLTNVCEMSTGNSISDEIKEIKYKNRLDGLNYIGTKDVGFDRKINYENGIKIPIEDNFRIAHKGSTLLCIEGGSAGKKIAITEEDVCYGNKLCCFETQAINNKFIFYYLQSSIFSNHFINNLNGIIGGVSINNLKTILIGIPPLGEQERIVNKIEELFSEIDKIEKAQDELDNLKEMARTKVLDLSVRGKLVKQDPNDEPASVLLEKIKQEKEKLIKEGKIKRDKNESIIYKGDDKNYYEKIGNKVTNITNEIPFDIPDNWSFVRLLVICSILPTRNNQIDEKDVLKEGDIPVISQSKHLIDGYTNQIGKKLSTDKPLILFGDHTKVVKYIDFDFVVGADGTKLLKPYVIDSKWFYYNMVWHATQIKDRGYARHFILLKNSLVGLPPLQEQEKISAKLDYIYNLLIK